MVCTYVPPATLDALNIDGRASRRMSMLSLDSWRLTEVKLEDKEKARERQRERHRDNERER